MVTAEFLVSSRLQRRDSAGVDRSAELSGQQTGDENRIQVTHGEIGARSSLGEVDGEEDLREALRHAFLQLIPQNRSGWLGRGEALTP